MQYIDLIFHQSKQSNSHGKVGISYRLFCHSILLGSSNNILIRILASNKLVLSHFYILYKLLVNPHMLNKLNGKKHIYYQWFFSNTHPHILPYIHDDNMKGRKDENYYQGQKYILNTVIKMTLCISYILQHMAHSILKLCLCITHLGIL